LGPMNSFSRICTFASLQDFASLYALSYRPSKDKLEQTSHPEQNAATGETVVK
jgi:hypothetical protein